MIGQCVRELGISEWTYYRWRKQYAGMNKADAKKLKELEKENARLKKLLADPKSPVSQLGVLDPGRSGESVLVHGAAQGYTGCWNTLTLTDWAKAGDNAP